MGHLAKDWERPRRARTARQAVLTAGAVLMAGAWIGNHLLLYSGIKIGGLRVACSLLVLLSCLTELLRDEAPESLAAGLTDDDEMDVAPLGVPWLASVAALGTVVVYSGETHELWRRLVTLSVIVVVMAGSYPLLRGAPRVLQVLGPRGLPYASQLLRLSAVAWAVDFLSIGIRDLLHLITSTPPAR